MFPRKCPPQSHGDRTQRHRGFRTTEFAPQPCLRHSHVALHDRLGNTEPHCGGSETNYDYINKRIDGTAYVLEAPLKSGNYRITVNAYDSNDVKLAESPGDITFSVQSLPIISSPPWATARRSSKYLRRTSMSCRPVSSTLLRTCRDRSPAFCQDRSI